MLKKTILVVDDDVDLLMLLERILLDEGYLVETVCSIPEAEEFLLNHAPSLVLLDININGSDGRQLCWKLKNGSDKPPYIIIMSGYDCNLPRSILFGADDFIAKPFELEFLLLKLQSYFQKLQSSPGQLK